MTEFAAEWEMLAERILALKKLELVVERVIEACCVSLAAGNKILFCGNGGSASQSQHLAAELVGRYNQLYRPAMYSVALSVDTSILTAVANDYGFDDVFRRQVEGIGRPGDVLFGLSTSGDSLNVVRAFEIAREKKITTVALVGSKPGRLLAAADFVLAVPAETSNHIQEMHLAIGHWICGEIERRFYGENADFSPFDPLKAAEE